ncbi:TniB family NTP-binding protein [Gynuella sp.]|uniref:TniB family NTP-binding protein n=1 Tax=Gynuella sp. TaxID=2969146 RepID=UPI003D1224C1
MDELNNIDITRVTNLNFKIPHRNWKQALAEAYILMTTAMPGEVICIYGPSRAGKSSMLLELRNAICGNPKQNQNEMPFVLLEIANNGGKAAFSYKAFLLDMLELIQHPIYSTRNSGGWSDFTKSKRSERATEVVLAQALVEPLKNMNTLFWVLDEAQHVRYAGKDVLAASGVMDAIKNLAKKASVVLVICGTYPVLQSINYSGHLENRKHDVHLARYRNTDDDLKEFIWILDNYGSNLDLAAPLGSLRNCAEILYKGSFGCIGSVRAILYRASVYAALEHKKINLSHIQRGLKSPNQLVTAAMEIWDGERLLGSEPCMVLEEVVMTQTAIARGKVSGKPFQRKPKRYDAGNRL